MIVSPFHRLGVNPWWPGHGDKLELAHLHYVCFLLGPQPLAYWQHTLRGQKWFFKLNRHPKHWSQILSLSSYFLLHFRDFWSRVVRPWENTKNINKAMEWGLGVFTEWSASLAWRTAFNFQRTSYLLSESSMQSTRPLQTFALTWELPLTEPLPLQMAGLSDGASALWSQRQALCVLCTVVLTSCSLAGEAVVYQHKNWEWLQRKEVSVGFSPKKERVLCLEFTL